MPKLFGVVLPMVGIGMVGCALDESAATDAVSIDDPGVAVMERHGPGHLPSGTPVPNASGRATTLSTTGSIDLGNEFFQDLGTNGRRCVSCHLPSAGWGITPPQVRAIFEATRGGQLDDQLGLGAIFRTNDGSNSPDADVSTVAKRRQAYTMLLNHGLIRVGLPVPAAAEFELVAVDDPYHHASAADVSMFRRPLPSANLKFLSTVMFDGRETVPGQAIAADLATQASDATMTHAQGQALTEAQRESIVRFETALATAQIIDRNAGNLHAAGAKGGPDEIFKQEFHIGINDNFGDPVTGKPFTPIVFDIYDRWLNIGDRRDHDGHGHGHDCDDDDHGHGRGHDCDDDDDHGGINADRRAIARGQALFNTKKINISGVSGINDEAAFGKPANLVGTCTTCHDAPNAGDHSVVAPLNIGLADASRRTPDMPLYTLRNKTTHETIQVTDPGRALIDGKWSHIGRFKGPILRDLSARAPYFHNGFAADFDAVIDFYEDRFHIGFTKQERSDIIAFLRAL